MDFDRPAQLDAPSPDGVIARPFRILRADASGAGAALVARRYAWRGYDAALLPDNGFDPSSCSIEARAFDGAVLGALTVRLGDLQSLHCSDSYPDVIAPWIRRGARLAEVCRLAVEPSACSRVVLASMFHIAYLYATLRGVERIFIEVNPRHVAFYQRAIGFEIAAGERHCPRANAPAVLLTAPRSLIGHRMATYGGLGRAARGGSRNSIYPYCFGRAEEPGLLTRVIHMETFGHELLFDGDVAVAKAA